ncbi:SgcJ/EcaC family oxidoreductase [Aurantiacibacter sp. MUD11]|uniref:YybH family protein n=1 Tax=Aurantiacibacter sp. MUD11 TaxID=3003265 RepID=UPI0022AB0EAA|nr:SgcJ/EcaC family oxidoreductase [Aurantiacibacter sp. MUD11]WAT17461.1 SgcJ/EcaC family oxidoreductase [Aurantiacibacter sp. MUD11]
MRLVAPALALLLAACAPDADVGSQEPESVAAPQVADIEAVMQDSAVGWNEGDMDRFLAIYSEAPETSFVGSDGLVRGRAAMEERYRDAYDWSQPDPAERGMLSFETVDFRPLGDGHALYIGRYILTYPDAREPATGLTSLVFAREDGSWRIIADHSS